MAIIPAGSYKSIFVGWLKNIITVCIFTLYYTTVTQQQQPWIRKVTQAKATRSRQAVAVPVEDSMENRHPGKLEVAARCEKRNIVGNIV